MVFASNLPSSFNVDIMDCCGRRGGGFRLVDSLADAVDSVDNPQDERVENVHQLCV